MSDIELPDGLDAMLVAALPVGVVVSHFPTDDLLDGYVEKANEAASTNLGVDLAASIGVSFRDQVAADSTDNVLPSADAGLQISFDVAVTGRSQSFANYAVGGGAATGHYQSTVFALPERRSVGIFRRIDTELAARRALDWAVQSMESANAELAKFASTVAHDLKNPLAAISGYAQVLQMQRASLPESVHESVDRIVELADLSAGMIDGLLRYAKKPALAGDDTVDLTQVMGWVESIVAEQLAEANGTLSYASLPLVNGNEAALRQVFLNLTINAIRYRHPDRSLNIEVRSTVENVIEVVDNGKGIARYERDRVFDWGYRSDNVGQTIGSGMGLAACRSVLLNLGGDIAVGESPANGGTTMLVTVRRF